MANLSEPIQVGSRPRAMVWRVGRLVIFVSHSSCCTRHAKVSTNSSNTECGFTHYNHVSMSSVALHNPDSTLCVRVQALALELAADEATHVAFLRSALGSAAVSKPAVRASVVLDRRRGILALLLSISFGRSISSEECITVCQCHLGSARTRLADQSNPAQRLVTAYWAHEQLLFMCELLHAKMSCCSCAYIVGRVCARCCACRH